MALLRLEAFEPDTIPDPIPEPAAEPPEFQERRLEAYENGYQNGWDDALNAQAGEQTALRADLARNLQALNFTYQEARAHVLKSVAPLLEVIVGTLLPDIARQTLGPAIIEAMMPLAEQGADSPVSIVLNPADRIAVEEFLRQGPTLPMIVREEPGLSESQAFLRLGDAEVKVDPGDVAARISQLVKNYLSSAGDNAHG